MDIHPNIDRGGSSLLRYSLILAPVLVLSGCIAPSVEDADDLDEPVAASWTRLGPEFWEPVPDQSDLTDDLVVYARSSDHLTIGILRKASPGQVVSVHALDPRPGYRLGALHAATADAHYLLVEWTPENERGLMVPDSSLALLRLGADGWQEEELPAALQGPRPLDLASDGKHLHLLVHQHETAMHRRDVAGQWTGVALPTLRSSLFAPEPTATGADGALWLLGEDAAGHATIWAHRDGQWDALRVAWPHALVTATWVVADASGERLTAAWNAYGLAGDGLNDMRYFIGHTTGDAWHMDAEHSGELVTTSLAAHPSGYAVVARNQVDTGAAGLIQIVVSGNSHSCPPDRLPWAKAAGDATWWFLRQGTAAWTSLLPVDQCPHWPSET